MDPLQHHSEYEAARLDETDLDADPFAQLARWLGEAADAGLVEPNAMVLGTVDPDGAPSARTVLLRGLDHGLRFFTNRESRKGRALAHLPAASAVFPWYPLQRQVIVTGAVELLSDAEDDAYFASRPWGSRVAARASDQSRPIASRGSLEAAYAREAAAHPDEVPRPAEWGGYRLVPSAVEFWQGRRSRMHDRLRFTREDAGWTVTRLQP